MKKKFGGAQEGAGKKLHSASGKQRNLTFGAAPDCEKELDALMAQYGKSRGKIICAAVLLSKRHPDEFEAILADSAKAQESS